MKLLNKNKNNFLDLTSASLQDLNARLWRSQRWIAEISDPHDKVLKHGMWRSLTQDDGDLSTGGWRSQSWPMEISILEVTWRSFQKNDGDLNDGR